MSSISPQKKDNAEIIINPVARTADEVKVALPEAANSLNTGSPKNIPLTRNMNEKKPKNIKGR